MALKEDLRLPSDDTLLRDYYELVESHLSYLIANTTEQITITQQQAAQYRGDFYGLLDLLGIEKKFQYPIMRANGLLSSDRFDGTKIQLLKPPFELIGNMFTIYQSKEN